MKKIILFLLSLLVLACGLPGTGGGGGGEEFNGPAFLALSANPQVIDAGEIIYVELYSQEVHEEGVLIKFKYHYGLDYIEDSATLNTNRGEIAIRPTHNERSSEHRYLTFFLEQSEFGTDRKGTIKLELQGRRRVNDGNFLEVDADIEDSRKDDFYEFSLERPRFSAEDAVKVQVEN